MDAWWAPHQLHTTDSNPRATHSSKMIIRIELAWLEGKRIIFGWFRVKLLLTADFLRGSESLSWWHCTRSASLDTYKSDIYCTAKILVFYCRSCAIRRYYAALHQLLKGYLYCKMLMFGSAMFFLRPSAYGEEQLKEPWRQWILLNYNWNAVTPFYLYK